ncbi:M16 family metallopeptidase [Belliella kenyensis]|uniref:M16 family metallopeptidase n=1 Tax=Belliella kenyensis TaxID=1472724 RepID=A0ABV8EGW7_9BACT|nr:pitrilysin family protein [Belliella kenyensis]MCH7403061.1 insulinase family protein [Belliella kenyensis]MDN3602230.1 pitrilysin family protein [Belliella kenyensis]
MKKLYIILLLISLSFVANAQLDRSKMPEAGPAPEIRFGDAESFTLPNGLKVFVIQNSKLPRVTYSLILDRDPILEGDKAGMLDFVGEMITAGTKNRSKDQFNEEVDFLGARISASSTSISASTLTKHQEKVLELMADVLFNPIFPEEELQKLKTQAKSGIAAAKSDPSTISSILTSKLVFGTDHPYGESETEETIDNIEVADIKAYYETYYRPNIAYLAIVGDVTLDQAKKLVNKHFAKWEKKEVPKHEYKKPQIPERNTVALVDRPSAQQSVVELTYPIENHLPSPDYLASQVAGFILGGGGSSRLFMNLREDKGYTYGAYARIGSNSLVSSFSANASVRGTATDSAIYEMIHEIRNMKDNGVTQEELDAAKANLSGSFGRSLESPSTIANFAINIERYGLPKDYYATYLQRLNALTVEEVNEAAKKFLKPDNMYITIVGNGSLVSEGLMAYGDINRFNTAGDPEKIIAMDADMTVEKVLEKYFEALGGVDKVKSVRTAVIEANAEIQGMKLGMNFYHDENKEAFSNKVLMGGNVMSNTIIKDGKASVVAMGQTQQLPDEQYEEAKLSMYIFPELHFESLGYTLKLDGIKEVEGENAYKLIVTTASGSSSDFFFGVESGLKLKMESPTSGEVVYNNYREVNGVKYPMLMTISNPMIPVPLAAKVENIEFNVSIEDEQFN